TSAVNTASNITRGFMSEKKSGRRAVKRDREAKCRREMGIAVVFTVKILSAPQICFRGVDDVGANVHDRLYPARSGVIAGKRLMWSSILCSCAAEMFCSATGQRC